MNKIKIAIFVVVFISLSMVTVGARLIWDSGFKRAGDPIDLQNNLAQDSLTNRQWPVYNRPLEEGRTMAGPDEKAGVGNEIQRSAFYGAYPAYNDSARSVYNDVEFNTLLGSGLGSRLNSNLSQWFDVEATQNYIASFMDRPDMNRRGGSGSNSRGGSGGSAGSVGGSGGGTGSGGGKGIPGYLNDPVPETDVADGGNSEIPDWVYPPNDGENSGDFPDALERPLVKLVSSVESVPEPSTMLLFGAGLAGLVGYRLRKKKS